jgi:hypothetical protein
MTRSRFSRPDGEIAGPFPAQGELQAQLALRLMGGCHDPFGDDSARGASLVATVAWATIAPSFHAWSELGLVRTEREGRLHGHRLGMIVGGAPAAAARVDLAPGELEEPRFEPPPLWPREPEGVMLDGCSYSLTFAGLSSTSTVRFQPVAPSRPRAAPGWSDPPRHPRMTDGIAPRAERFSAPSEDDRRDRSPSGAILRAIRG